MKIIIKPAGAIALLAAIVALGLLAFRSRGTAAPAVAGGAAAAAPAPATKGSGTPAVEVIYGDATENGWQAPGWSWAKDVNYDSHEMVHSGSSAVRAHFGPFEGVKFYNDHPVDQAKYDRITFFVRGGGNGGHVLKLSAGLNGKAVGHAVNLSPLPAGQWAAVTVPLATFGVADPAGIGEFWIQEFAGKEQTPLFLDDIRLIGGAEPSPQGPALAWTVDPTVAPQG